MVGSLVGLPVWLLLCLLDCSVCLVCLCNFCVQIFIRIHVRLRRRVHVWQGHVHVCQRVCVRVHSNFCKRIRKIQICRKIIKVGPMPALFEIEIRPFFENLVLPAERRRFLKEKHKNNFKHLKLVEFCCATYLDQDLTLTCPMFNFEIPWPNVKL